MLAVVLNRQFGTLTGGASQVGPQVWSFVKAAKENCYSVQYCSSCREPGSCVLIIFWHLTPTHPEPGLRAAAAPPPPSQSHGGT